MVVERGHQDNQGKAGAPSCGDASGRCAAPRPSRCGETRGTLLDLVAEARVCLEAVDFKNTLAIFVTTVRTAGASPAIILQPELLAY